MSQDRSFIKSGRNTIIHKDKKLDLVIVNSEIHPKIKVTQHGLEPFKEELPKNRREAKERYLVDELNTSDDVLVRACKDADVFEVNYKFKQTLQDKLGAAVEAGVARAANKLLAADRSKDFQ